MTFYIKGGMQDKGVWKQNLEGNIWAQEGEKGSREDSTMRNVIICIVHLI